MAVYEVSRHGPEPRASKTAKNWNQLQKKKNTKNWNYVTKNWVRTPKNRIIAKIAKIGVRLQKIYMLVQHP